MLKLTEESSKKCKRNEWRSIPQLLMPRHEKTDNVRVALRCRPISKKEMAEKASIVVDCDHDRCMVHLLPVDNSNNII